MGMFTTSSASQSWRTPSRSVYPRPWMMYMTAPPGVRCAPVRPPGGISCWKKSIDRMHASSRAGWRYHFILPWRLRSQLRSFPLMSHEAFFCWARCLSRRAYSQSSRLSSRVAGFMPSGSLGERRGRSVISLFLRRLLRQDALDERDDLASHLHVRFHVVGLVLDPFLRDEDGVDVGVGHVASQARKADLAGPVRLPILREQPVQVHLQRVRVGDIAQHGEGPISRREVRALLNVVATHQLHRQAALDVLVREHVAGPEGDGV